MDVCETIMIKGSDGGPLRINASDFKVGEHELYEAPAASDADKDDKNASSGSAGTSGAAPTGQPIPGASPMGAPAPKGAAAPK